MDPDPRCGTLNDPEERGQSSEVWTRTVDPDPRNVDQQTTNDEAHLTVAAAQQYQNMTIVALQRENERMVMAQNMSEAIPHTVSSAAHSSRGRRKPKKSLDAAITG